MHTRPAGSGIFRKEWPMLRWMVFAFVLVAGAGGAATLSWRAATEYPATAMPGEGLSTLARLVGERSNGALQIAAKFDGPDGLRSANIIEAVRAGRLEIGDAFAGSIGSLDPLFLIASLPFLATTPAEARRLYESARPAYERAFGRQGQILLYATPWPPSGIWSAKPIRAASDLKGLAIRTYDKTGTAVLAEAGAAPVEISFADAMPRLRDGRVTAVLSSGDGGAGRKLWEFLPHFTEIGYAVPLSFTTVSATAYNALDPAMQALVRKAAADTEATQWAALLTRTASNYATMRQNGVSIGTATPELAKALADAAKATIADWEAKAGSEAGDILKQYRAGR
jgi:TRAP-type C4-dicarboxylate transport system substrate-binding protein